METIIDDNYESRKLNVGDVFSNGVKIGMKNFLSLIGAVILWMLTIWIPYINVGTTIAIASFPVAMSKGKVVSPTEIFNPKYRELMGEFFLLLGLRSLMTTPGYMFMFIPGIIMSITYSMGLYIVLDKRVEPSKALMLSNKATNGNKMTIFLSMLALFAPFLVFALIGQVIPAIGGILGFIYILALMPIRLGMDAYVYSQLCGGIEVPEDKI